LRSGVQMKTLELQQIQQVSGGKCQEIFELQIPLAYVDIVIEHIAKIQRKQFDPAAFLQDLTDRGLDPNLVMLDVTLACPIY